MFLVQELTFSNWKITAIFSICLKLLSISAKEQPESDPKELKHSWFRFISTCKKIFLEMCCVTCSGLVQQKVIQVTLTWVLASSNTPSKARGAYTNLGKIFQKWTRGWRRARVKESKVKSPAKSCKCEGTTSSCAFWQPLMLFRGAVPCTKHTKKLLFHLCAAKNQVQHPEMCRGFYKRSSTFNAPNPSCSFWAHKVLSAWVRGLQLVKTFCQCFVGHQNSQTASKRWPAVLGKRCKSQMGLLGVALVLNTVLVSLWKDKDPAWAQDWGWKRTAMTHKSFGAVQSIDSSRIHTAA